MQIEIRPAVTADAVDACGVLRRSITECCIADHHQRQPVLEAWLGNKTPANVAGWIASPSNYTLVALMDGALVGVALLTQAGKLSLCYLLPEAQYVGIGKALLHGIEAQARAWDISVLRLHSTASASDFYARNGYVRAGKEKSCYGVECDFFWKKLDADGGDSVGAGKRFCNCGA